MNQLLHLLLNHLRKTSDRFRFSVPDRTCKHPVRYIPGKPGECGIACVLMALDYFQKPVSNIFEFIQTHQTPANYNPDSGWNHFALAKLLIDQQLQAKVQKFTCLNQLVSTIKSGGLAIVSLSVPAIDNLLPNQLYKPRNSNITSQGHLCLLVGFSPTDIIIHDPRNMPPHAAFTRIPIDHFSHIFTGKCITISQA